MKSYDIAKDRGFPCPDLERLLTLKEAADVLRLHPRTGREYVRRGELEGRVIGNSIESPTT